MNSTFIYSDNNKRYHTHTYHLSNKFGKKVAKISLDGGFTCPNIDGQKGTGGCTYCSKMGGGEFSGNRLEPIETQFKNITDMMSRKWQDSYYIAYFQAFTNTYAPLYRLKELYESALRLKGVVGLSIATRADCISRETADYLECLSKSTYLTVELGLQTIHDRTGDRINRCHSYNDFLKGLYMLTDRGIDVCVHIINGLPGEDRGMMVESAMTISKLPIRGVKIHQLHVLKDTAIDVEYQKGQFKLLERDEYVNIVCDQLEYFAPHVVIQRLTGDGKLSDLIGPMWSVKKLVVMNEIDKEFLRRGSMQGIKWEGCV